MSRRRYLILNKPYGVLSQFTPELPGQRTLSEFELPQDVYAAGRLDHDSEGLLLLTNDNRLISHLLDPTAGHPRTYLVQVEGTPDENALAALRRGIALKDIHTRPAHVRRLTEEPQVGDRIPPIRQRKSIPTSWIELTLTEGKNRQVRRMTAHVGYPTLRLIRIRIGTLSIEGLGSGEWRELSAREVEVLFESMQNKTR